MLKAEISNSKKDQEKARQIGVQMFVDRMYKEIEEEEPKNLQN